MTKEQATTPEVIEKKPTTEETEKKPTTEETEINKALEQTETKPVPEETETKQIPEVTKAKQVPEKSEPTDDAGTVTGAGKNSEALDNGVKKPGRFSIRKLISTLLVVAGIALIAVPLVITYFNTKRNEDIIDKFLADAQMAVSNSQEIADEEIEPLVPSAEPAPATDDEVNPAATAAPGNSDSAATPVSSPQAPLAAAESASATPKPQPPGPTKKPLMSAAEIQKRMTGVLMIKKIDLRMVIMDGVDEETLRVAAGRMTETGNFDEIGNVVLAGHRSYTFGKYFNRLDELVPGDEIIVQTKTKTLKYTIYKKFVIEPDDLSITDQNETDKILTLFTCTPVVIADHRLVIQAKQVN